MRSVYTLYLRIRSCRLALQTLSSILDDKGVSYGFIELILIMIRRVAAMQYQHQRRASGTMFPSSHDYPRKPLPISTAAIVSNDEKQDPLCHNAVTDMSCISICKKPNDRVHDDSMSIIVRDIFTGPTPKAKD